jgi:hypothetical protein
MKMGFFGAGTGIFGFFGFLITLRVGGLSMIAGIGSGSTSGA